MSNIHSNSLNKINKIKKSCKFFIFNFHFKVLIINLTQLKTKVINKRLSIISIKHEQG